MAEPLNRQVNRALGFDPVSITDRIAYEEFIKIRNAINIINLALIQPANANQAALTNNTGGTYNGVLQPVSGSGADNAINNNFTELHTLLDAIRTALVNTNLIKGSA